MTHRALRLFGAAVLPVALGACASASTGGSPGGASLAATSAHAPAQPCVASALALGYGPRVSPATGEQAVIYRIRNRGPACWLSGYPEVTLDDANGARLAFHYTRGHSQYVTSAKPERIVLAAGGSGFVLVAKYRCDVGALTAAADVTLTLPGHPAIILKSKTAAPRSGGVAELDYCKGGPRDPGQTVAISPVEATPGAVG